MDTTSPISAAAPPDELSLELQVYYAGEEACAPGHGWGPLVRDHFVLHLIDAGRGVFESGGHRRELGPGQGFLLWPGVKAHYQADRHAPWRYRWVGLNGAKAARIAATAGLTPETPEFAAADRAAELAACQRRILAAAAARGAARALAETGALFELFAILAGRAAGRPLPPPTRQECYIQRAMEFVERNHSRTLSVAEIARQAGIERSHLAHLFRQTLNTSPAAYVISVRIRKAAELLLGRPDLSVKEIAYSVGYGDPLFFSKSFKKLKGLPPLDFRQRAGLSRVHDSFVG